MRLSNEGVIKFRKADRSIWINGRRLSPRPSQAVRNHSPDGFNWGYCGSGPAQTALAILLAIGGQRKGWCIRNYQQFKVDVISYLPQNQDCEIPISVVRQWVADHTEKEGPGLQPW
jgi:hypothetical protein